MGGSVEICISAIAKELAKEHRVTVIGRRHSRLPVQERDGALTYVRVKAGSSSAYLRNVLLALRRGSYDLIQVDNRPHYAAAIKAAFPHTPVALFLHSLTFVSPPQISAERAAALLAKPDFVVANSASLYKELSQRYPKCRRSLRKVWLGVDAERFRPPSVEEKRRMKQRYGLDGSFTVLFVGRVIPRKGIPVLLKAMRHVRRSVPNAKLVIAGTGKASYLRKLKGQARKLRVPAVFTGLLSHKSIHRIYRLADCFVCPSQRHEAFGLVNVEAMACGVPVVASRIGGIGEAVQDGKSGFLVNAYRDPAAFARSIARIGTEAGLARKLAEQAREDAVAKFGWAATAKKLVAIYRHKTGAALHAGGSAERAAVAGAVEGRIGRNAKSVRTDAVERENSEQISREGHDEEATHDPL
jgi:spore coat protein SA